MKVFRRGFFLPNLCAWDHFHSIAMETKGQTRPKPERCPLHPYCLDSCSEMQQTHCWQLHSWDQCLHTSPPALQHRSSGLDLQSNTISTSTKDSPLRFLTRALGVRQQLQTCTKAMAGRIGKLQLLFNKLQNYVYVTVIWEREALLVMIWITDRKKVKQIRLGVENNLACGTFFSAFIDNNSKTFVSNCCTSSKSTLW